MTDPVLDPATLERLNALQAAVGEQEQVVAELTNIFRRDSAIYLEKLKIAAVAPDGEEARRLVHTLKGAALGVGASRVAARCALAEAEGSTQSDTTRQELEALVAEALQALDAL